MSVNKKSDSRVLASYGYVISEGVPGHIEGRVLTLIETLGLPEKQEEAIKGLVRQAIWDCIHPGAIYITPERHTQIWDEYQEARKESERIGQPVSAI